MPRVGVLWHAANAREEAEYLGALTKAFHELGYVEGKNIELDHRFPAEQPERFHTLAQELVESKVDMIVAVTGLGAKAAKQATGTIPIVLVADPDPVGNGFAQSLARPGSNITGLSLMASDTSSKRLALFKETVPKLARVAVVLDPRDPFSKASGVAYERAAKALGFLIQIFDVTTPDDIERAFSSIARDGFDGGGRPRSKPRATLRIEPGPQLGDLGFERLHTFAQRLTLPFLGNQNMGDSFVRNPGRALASPLDPGIDPSLPLLSDTRGHNRRRLSWCGRRAAWRRVACGLPGVGPLQRFLSPDQGFTFLIGHFSPFRDAGAIDRAQ